MERLWNWCYWSYFLANLALCQVRPADDLQDALQTLGLTKFLQHLREAGLSHILYNGDKCTLFAPTNEAFAKLEARSVHNRHHESAGGGVGLTKEELKRLLLYHAAYSEWRAQDWTNEALIPTALTGMNMRVNVYEQPHARKDAEKVTTLSGVQVISTNNRARNGIVHVLDDFVYPMPLASAYDTLASLPGLDRFKALLEEFRMIAALRYEEPLTIFAPSDDAFRKLPPQFMDTILLQPSAMAAILNYHLVNGTYHANGLFRNIRMRSLESSEVVVTSGFGAPDHHSVQLNHDANILRSLPVTNGVLHVIDALLLPPANPKQLMYAAKDHVQFDSQKGFKRK